MEPWSFCEYVVTCLVEGLHKVAYRAVNYDNLRYPLRQKMKTWLSFATIFRYYMGLDPEAAEDQLILNVNFITQSAPDIQKKLQKLEAGP